MSVAGAIGLDLGSQTAVLTVAKKGGVEIVLNEANYRETQMVVGFGDNERFIGEAGAVQLKSNFKNTIVYASRFLGLKPDSPLVTEEKKWLYSPLVTTASGQLGFEVRYRGEKKTFVPEQIVAMILQKLHQNCKKIGIGHNDMVISCPSYYTEQERKALLDAAKIAGINCVRLLNESTANVLSYGIFRKAELDTNPKYVAFIDLGHANTSSFVASFTSAEAKILNQVHERNLGTRDMDWVVFEHCAKVFQDKTSIGIKNNAKARLRLLDTIEKQRKVLSANSEAAINVDCLAEDEDFEIILKREDFEQMIAPTLQKFRQSLEKLKTETKVQIQAVEIIGGGTRIPAVQKIIQEVFGMEVSRTLNATECCSRGCAIHAAMLSPLFKVAEYKVEEANYYPIRCSWLFQSPEDKNMSVEADAKNNPEKQTSILFDKGCAIPSVKAITFHRDDPLINFKLAYDPIPEGIQSLLANYAIHSLKPKEAEYGIKVRVVLNKNGLVELESAALNEDYYVEETAEKKDIQPEKKEGEQASQEVKPEENKEEPKKKKKTRSTTLKADFAHINQLDSASLHQYLDEEHKMANADRIIHETYHTKNSLESYIYETRGKLNDQYSSYVHQNVKDTFLGELQKAETWLYSDGANTSKEAYLKKIDDLKFFGNPIERRYKEYNNLPEAIQNFGQTLNGFEQVITSNEDKYSHITSDERKPVLESIANNRKWLNDLSEKIKTAHRSEEPPAKCQEINDTLNNFVNEYSKVINKPKPKPQEPPKQEKKDIVDEKGTAEGENKDGDSKKDIEEEK